MKKGSGEALGASPDPVGMTGEDCQASANL